MSAEAVVIRKCNGLDEIRACVALQKEVWDFADIEIVPLRTFVAGQKIGGQVIGAFEGSELIGFAFALPGYRGEHPYLFSNMLAVREHYRNSGVGRRLKLFQRDDALARGFELMEWTFDPLEIKNSHLNLEKLGAIARRYEVNQYGINTSRLQGGLPTDRLVAEWWLKSERVEQLLNRGFYSAFEVVEKICVPAEIYAWKSKPENRHFALEIQKRNRIEFESAFREGLAALGYERDSQGNGTFLLGRWDENWHYASD